MLIAACASCRSDAPDSSAASQTANVTATPVKLVKRQPDNLNFENADPDDANPDDAYPDDSNPYDMESIDGNPLGGCVGCHIDVEDECVGSAHQAEQIGCVECHGPSDGHIRDENNEVKPDEIFAREDVDRLCKECHECSRPPGVQPAAEPPADRKVCTDCHHPHSLVLAGRNAQE